MGGQPVFAAVVPDGWSAQSWRDVVSASRRLWELQQELGAELSRADVRPDEVLRIARKLQDRSEWLVACAAWDAFEVEP